MDFIKRAVSVPEKFYFEVTIHSVDVHLPLECFIQVVVKRNQKKKEKTPKYPYYPSSPTTQFDTTLSFPVTLYKSNSSYNKKKYFFRLVQLTSKKSIKNGKASFNLPDLLNDSNPFQSLRLQNCTDSKATINLTLSLSRLLKTESLALNLKVPEFDSPDRSSRSFDYSASPEAIAYQKQVKREKYLRSIHKVNSFHNSPMSASIMMDSEVSSCASPLSPIKYFDSPVKEDSSVPWFEIKPIKIEEELSEDSDTGVKHLDFEDTTNNASVEGVDEESNSKFEKSEDFIETIPIIPDISLGDAGKEAEWTKYIREEDTNFHRQNSNEESAIDDTSESSPESPDKDLPKSQYNDASPGCNNKSHVSIEASNPNTGSKCCKCRII